MEQSGFFKKIFGNSVWQISEKIITMLLGVIAISFVARYLGTEQYGWVNYIMSVVTLFTSFSTFGMERITINDIVSKKYDKSEVLGTSLVIRIVGGIILIVIAQITLFILNGANLEAQIIGLIMGSCMLFKASEVIEYYFQAQMNMKVISIIRCVTAVVVSITRILIVVFNLGVVGFAATYLVDAFVAGLLFYIWYKHRNKSKFKVNKNYAKVVLSKCWYIAVAGLMSTIYMRIDQVMLGSMLANKSENGIYSAAVRIAEMWYFIPAAIITAFQPIIMQQKENNEIEYKRLMQKLYDIVAIVGVIFASIITIFGKIPVYILYGSEYLGAEKVLAISTWAGIFATLGGARSVWLITENLQKYTLLYTGIGCIINVVLNFILIPIYGAVGAAIATLTTQFVANVIALMLIKETRISSIMILKALFKNSTFIEFLKMTKDKIRKKEIKGE